MSHESWPSKMTRSMKTSRSMDTDLRLARGLGLFSIGLGLFELFLPRKLTSALGMNGKELLVRAYGVREIIAGVGALSSHPTPAIWSRVAGDAMDLGTLIPALRESNPKRANACVAVGVVLGAVAVDVYCARALSNRSS